MPCLDGFKYFKVIYSLQSDPFCYFITFSYIFMTTPRVCWGEPKIKKIIIKQLLSYQLFLLVYVVNHWYTSNILIHWKDPSYVLKLDGSDSKHLAQHIVSVVNIWRIINTVAPLHLVRKFARVFPGHYLFLEAHSFPRVSLSENCSHLGTHIRPLQLCQCTF